MFYPTCQDHSVVKLGFTAALFEGNWNNRAGPSEKLTRFPNSFRYQSFAWIVGGSAVGASLSSFGHSGLTCDTFSALGPMAHTQRLGRVLDEQREHGIGRQSGV
jgi:hypothetical protein